MTWKRIFRSKMRDEDWMLDTVEIWAIALTDLQITKGELMLAQRKSMALEWPPTAPSDFLKLARQEVSQNYPDMRAAYLSAANGNYSAHAVIYETAKRVGFWDLKSKAESVTYKSWQQHYPKVCSEHASGAQFALPKERQLSYSHTPVQPNSPFNAKIDAFFEQFGSKGKAVAQ